MNLWKLAILLFEIISFPFLVHAESNCLGSALSDKAVREIIERERNLRGDLPKPFPKYRWIIRPKGCYYTYLEIGLPEAPEYNQSFTLNRHGVIVDAQISNSPKSPLKCPDKVFSDKE